MEITTRRVLTMKSKIGMGTYGDIPIERLLQIEPKAVRYAYYKFEVIDFTPEVKAAADIRIEIQKPGNDWNKYIENDRLIRESLTDDERIKAAAKAKRTHKITQICKKHKEALGRHMTKGYMQAVNHGRAYAKK